MADRPEAEVAIVGDAGRWLESERPMRRKSAATLQSSQRAPIGRSRSTHAQRARCRRSWADVKTSATGLTLSK